MKRWHDSKSCHRFLSRTRYGHLLQRAGRDRSIVVTPAGIQVVVLYDAGGGFGKGTVRVDFMRRSLAPARGPNLYQTDDN